MSDDIEECNYSCIDPIRLLVVSDGYSLEEYDEFYERFNEFETKFRDEEWGNHTITVTRKDDKDDKEKDKCKILPQKLFNIECLFCPSDESGVGVSRGCSGYVSGDIDNVFGSRYCHGRKVEMDGEVPLRILRGDAEKVKRELYSNVKWDYVLLLCNNKPLDRNVIPRKNNGNNKEVTVEEIPATLLRGGYADMGSKIAWISANSYDWYDLAMHELGHLIFNLHEEYDDFYGATSLSHYSSPEQMPESNIMSVTRVEYLLEKLRRYVIIKNQFRYYETYDGKDYLIESDKVSDFKENIDKLLSLHPEDRDQEKLAITELKEMGFSNREINWFELVNDADDYGFGTKLFKFCEVKKGPLKNKYKVIKFNVFWKRYDLLNQDIGYDESYFYHRRSSLNEEITDPCHNHQLDYKAGFFEGAGTYPYGMARPAWECRMRSTRSKEDREQEDKYFNHILDYGSLPGPNDCIPLPENSVQKQYCHVCKAAIIRKLKIYLKTESAYGSFNLGFFDIEEAPENPAHYIGVKIKVSK